MVGLGLLGGSILHTVAGALPARGWDHDPATRAAARTAGFDVPESLESAVADADVVVLAVPLYAMGQTAERIAPVLAPGTVVTDVGSVKGPVRRAVLDAGVTRYVGAHPMAGTEESGFAAADGGLLPGARWAVTVDDATDLGAVRTVLALITGPLRGEVSVLTDRDHDHAVALVSHVPHVMATELLRLVEASAVREVGLGLAAGSFRDGTRVGRTDPRKTEAMVSGNGASVARVLRAAAADLVRLADALDTREVTSGEDAVREFFEGPAGVRAAITARATEQSVVRADEVPLARRVVRASSDLVDLARRGAAGEVVCGVDGDDLLVRVPTRSS